jgi:DNA-binding transcriptional LysR family regulator
MRLLDQAAGRPKVTALTRSLTLRQLEIFTTAAHQGSRTRAAGALLLSGPAVSQQMKLLEKIVGAQLFERSPRRPIRLTEAGTILLQTCEGLLRSSTLRSSGWTRSTG